MACGRAEALGEIRGGGPGRTASRLLDWANGHEWWASAPRDIQSLSWEGAYSGTPRNLRHRQTGAFRRSTDVSLSQSSSFPADPWDHESVSVVRCGLRRQGQ